MRSPKIHPTAIVSETAKLGDGVTIGPYCVVDGDVELGNEVELISHVVVTGQTQIGAHTRIFPFASVGNPPQDLKYSGEKSRLVIGKGCTIRENVTINPGTRGGGMETRIGNDCLFMAGAHVAHDCRIGNNVIVANYVAIAGHCQIGDFVNLGGLVGVHQFVRIGSHAFIGAQSMVDADIIPYGMAVGNRARLAGLNLIGLKRRKFPREQIHQLRAGYRALFSGENTLSERVDKTAEAYRDAPLVKDVIAFIKDAPTRSLCLPADGELDLDTRDED